MKYIANKTLRFVIGIKQGEIYNIINNILVVNNKRYKISEYYINKDFILYFKFGR